ncbi:MAG: hypothetical protein IJX44_03745 [Bacteroidaceae bacterium]|nr:hypothetical protein [Bacteroidaceae bacterium]
MYISNWKYGRYECDKLKFSAFLYHLVKKTVMVSDGFNQTSFYQFIQEMVFRELKQNVRTFNNRVNKLNILDEAVKRPMDYAKHPDLRYFQHLKKKFRETNFFEGMERLSEGFSSFL